MTPFTIQVDLPPGISITACARPGDGYGFEVSWPLPQRCCWDRCRQEDKAAIRSRH